jgi:hypothetical protein
MRVSALTAPELASHTVQGSERCVHDAGPTGLLRKVCNASGYAYRGHTKDFEGTSLSRIG